MTTFVILYAVVLAIALALVLPRLPAMTPQLRRLFAMTAVAGVVAFAGVLWWSLSA